MFWMLTLKELKLIFKNITFYLFAIIVVLFYFSQYGESQPINTNKPLQPLSEMQFMYSKMLEDYHDGKLTNKALMKEHSLNSSEKAAIKAALEKMNPGALEKKENILDIRFHISSDEYLALMQELDSSLGGHTYYYDANAKTPLLSVENSYGSKEITDSHEKMKYTCYQMKDSLVDGVIHYYRLNIIASRNLSVEQKMLIRNAIDKILPNGVLDKNNPRFLVSYNECLSIVKDLDKQLGVNTFEKTLKGENISIGLTYEEALTEFQKLFGRDKLTNAYARCLSDYMGITAGFFPIFLAGFILTRDYRSRMHELIYSREVSSFVYVLSRFAAISIAVMLVYLGIAAHSTVVFVKLASIYGYTIDYLAFFKHILVWVMPTVLFTVSLGLLISILFRNGIVAVVIQLVLWFSSLMPLAGDYSLSKYIVRFNLVVNYEKYESYYAAIYINRLFFTLLAFILVAAASIILSWRRSTGYGGIWGFLKNRMVQR